METAALIQDTVLNTILRSLGMEPNDTEPCAEGEGFRIDFEHNFTIELQDLGNSDCRVSARIFSLGKSLQVQDNQIRLALTVFSELIDHMPTGLSTAISSHDNCLRLCLEISSQQTDNTMPQFQDFVQLAFAYKQTYFKHKSGA